MSNAWRYAMMPDAKRHFPSGMLNASTEARPARTSGVIVQRRAAQTSKARDRSKASAAARNQDRQGAVDDGESFAVIRSISAHHRRAGLRPRSLHGVTLHHRLCIRSARCAA